MRISHTERCFSWCRCFAHPAYCVIHYQANLDPSVADRRVQAECGASCLDFWAASGRIMKHHPGVGNFCGRTPRHLAIIGKRWRILAGCGVALGSSRAMVWPRPAVPVPTCQQLALPNRCRATLETHALCSLSIDGMARSTIAGRT